MTMRIGTLGFGTIGLAAALLLGSSAKAQINAPPPTLQDERAVHVFSVPGVINANGIGTIFACSNAGRSSTTLSVEVFGDAGGASLNDADSTSIVVSPGATALFGTTAAVALVVDGNLATGTFATGSARVLATNPKDVLCTAFLADTTSSPPASMTSLSVVKKTTQQGD